MFTLADILQIAHFNKDHAEITDSKKKEKYKGRNEEKKIHSVSIIFKEQTIKPIDFYMQKKIAKDFTDYCDFARKTQASNEIEPRLKLFIIKQHESNRPK